MGELCGSFSPTSYFNMTVQEIIERVRGESGRTDIPDATLYRWLNSYKLKLQRDRRLFLSQNSSQLEMKANNRSTSLPTDYLQPIAIRRATSETPAQTTDFWGNRHTVIREAVLHREVNMERFLDRFPLNRADGELWVSTPNEYIIQGRSIIWGPIPSADESLFIDYYRALPPYDGVEVSEDDLSIIFHDGLFSRCMELVFQIHFPDKEKYTWHMQERLAAEKSLMMYQVTQEHPMETDLNLPDAM